MDVDAEAVPLAELILSGARIAMSVATQPPFTAPTLIPLKSYKMTIPDIRGNGQIALEGKLMMMAGLTSKILPPVPVMSMALVEGPTLALRRTTTVAVADSAMAVAMNTPITRTGDQFIDKEIQRMMIHGW